MPASPCLFDGLAPRNGASEGGNFMRVLDLDMDFFLTDVCELAAEGARPSLKEARPWEEAEVRRFLEENCGLCRERPVPGAVFVTHDGALGYWEALLKRGALTAPFWVTHVDAHSDLGIGRPGPAFVLESVLSRPPARRVDLPRYIADQKLDEANYLLFALAFCWVSHLENVRNPHSRSDVPERIAVYGPGGEIEALQLQSSVSRLIPALDYHEPRVGYRAYADFRDFSADAPYDFATLAISPRYAPREADFIARLFREYIRESAQ